MIRITCTNCKAQLTIDDAFAGGVCRCQHCGTIETVPAALKQSAKAGDTVHAAVAAGSSKTLYENKARAGAARAGSGLDELGDAVASSGLGSGLRHQQQARANGAPDGQAPANPRLLPLVYGAAAVIVLLVAVIIGLVMHFHSAGVAPPPVVVNPSTPTNTPTPPDQPVRPTGPNLFGVNLAGANSVVYLLDRGQGTGSYFDALKQICLNSISSLGADRHFQIILWDNGSGPAAYPVGGPELATKANIDAARKMLDDQYAQGRSDVIGPLKAALASNPDLICLITGKSLDSDFADQVLAARKDSSVRIDCFYVGQEDSDGMLAKLAKTTGGEEHDITEHDLSTYQ